MLNKNLPYIPELFLLWGPGVARGLTVTYIEEQW